MFTKLSIAVCLIVALCNGLPISEVSKKPSAIKGKSFNAEVTHGGQGMSMEMGMGMDMSENNWGSNMQYPQFGDYNPYLGEDGSYNPYFNNDYDHHKPRVGGNGYVPNYLQKYDALYGK